MLLAPQVLALARGIRVRPLLRRRPNRRRVLNTNVQRCRVPCAACAARAATPSLGGPPRAGRPGSGAVGASTAAIVNACSASDANPLAAVAYSSRATAIAADAMPTSVFVIAAAAFAASTVTMAKPCSAASV